MYKEYTLVTKSFMIFFRNVDKIVVMKEGSVEEEGTHTQLMG